jgi:hypothetical protein
MIFGDLACPSDIGVVEIKFSEQIAGVLVAMPTGGWSTHRRSTSLSIATRCPA